MRHGSLFSGIGGFDLAASWMGWGNVFQVEWDKWCQKVLAKNFPNSLRFGDIVEFNKMLQNGEIITDSESWKSGQSETRNGRQNISRRSKKTHGQLSIGRIDILTGGFPCQPFSHAGKRKGTDDSRYLWPEMLTTIRIFKPSFVVGENVAGLVSMENGKTLDRILADLANEGYQTEQFIIPACAVGAWHRRDRIWIVARRNDTDTIINSEGSAYRGTVRGSSGGRKEQDQCQRNEMGSNTSDLCEDVPDTIGQRGCSRNTGGEYAKDVRELQRSQTDGYWDFEPSVGRVVNGIPNRVDRLKGLGNAIVPQVAYEIFKAIENYETTH